MIIKFNIHTFKNTVEVCQGMPATRVKAMRDITIVREWPGIPSVGSDVKLSCMSQPEKVTSVRYEDDGTPTVLISASDILVSKNIGEANGQE